jgi:hypothetical protein
MLAGISIRESEDVRSEVSSTSCFFGLFVCMCARARACSCGSVCARFCVCARVQCICLCQPVFSIFTSVPERVPMQYMCVVCVECELLRAYVCACACACGSVKWWTLLHTLTPIRLFRYPPVPREEGHGGVSGPPTGISPEQPESRVGRRSLRSVWPRPLHSKKEAVPRRRAA